MFQTGTKRKNKVGWLAVTAVLLFVSLSSPASAAKSRPNVVLILADDLGFGDTGCYGATKIPTPNMDRLGREGLRFTDAHATSATCTPSRYALLTGQYPWRKPGTEILPGNAPLIIGTNQTTLASIFKSAGYHTGVVGKWHLGLGGPNGADWNGEIFPGPNEIGFDYSFIMAATGDRVPCVYIENHRVIGLDPKDPIRVSYKESLDNEPTGKNHPELLKMGLTMGHCGRYQPHWIHVRRTGGALEGRRQGGCPDREVRGFHPEKCRVTVLSLFRHPRSARAPGAASPLHWEERLRFAWRCHCGTRLVRR